VTNPSHRISRTSFVAHDYAVIISYGTHAPPAPDELLVSRGLTGLPENDLIRGSASVAAPRASTCRAGWSSSIR